LTLCESAPRDHGIGIWKARDQDINIAHNTHRLLVPIEIGPHVGTALAAHRADETKLNGGQPDVIRPAVTADGDRVAAGVVRAIDDDAAHTSPNVIFCGCTNIWSAVCRPLPWAGLDSR